MFQFIRKHQAWGAVFIGAVILSFIVFMNPGGSGRAGGGPEVHGVIGGVPVREPEFRAAAREMSLELALRGQARASDRLTHQDVLNRVFALREARALGLRVSDEAVAARIVELPVAQDERTGRFSREAYQQFLQQVRQQLGFSESDFTQYIKHGIVLEQLATLAGVSGALVTPREAAARFRARHEQFAVQLVLFATSNQVAAVDLSPEAVGRFYSNNLPRYRLPEQVTVSYVRFATTNFLAEGEAALAGRADLETLLQAEYLRRGTNAFRDSAGDVLPAEAARAQLREEFVRQAALDAARRAANDFANELYRQEPSPDALREVAAIRGLSAAVSSPFAAASRGPAELRVPPQFVRAAFALTEPEPFGTPVIGEDGVYVFALRDRIPATIEPFEAVQLRVTEDWKRTESARLARARAEEFRAAATNALAAGRTFEATAAEFGVAPKALPPFSLMTPSLPELGARMTLNEVLQAVAELPAGAVSEVESTADGFFVAWLQERLPAPETQMAAELPALTEEMRRQGAFAAFNEWLMRRAQAVGVQGPPGVQAAPEGAAPL